MANANGEQAADLKSDIAKLSSDGHQGIAALHEAWQARNKRFDEYLAAMTSNRDESTGLWVGADEPGPEWDDLDFSALTIPEHYRA